MDVGEDGVPVELDRIGAVEDADEDRDQEDGHRHQVEVTGGDRQGPGAVRCSEVMEKDCSPSVLGSWAAGRIIRAGGRARHW